MKFVVFLAKNVLRHPESLYRKAFAKIVRNFQSLKNMFFQLFGSGLYGLGVFTAIHIHSAILLNNALPQLPQHVSEFILKLITLLLHSKQ